MYEYRKMTPEQRAQVVAERKARGHPWHAPPHFAEGMSAYLLTAACYEHRQILTSADRLSEFADALIQGVQQRVAGQVHAWVVLPNHYHLLASVDLAVFRPWIGRLHNGKSTQWNREDGKLGRKVWYRFSDRRIRNDRHYYASLNYIHANPVKHGYAELAVDWPWSSVHDYLETMGRDALADWWRKYPVRGYGKGWDDWTA